MKLINTSFNELIKDKKLTFLVGAGCSVNPPSSLPTGNEMMNDIIDFSCSENFKDAIKKLITEKILRFEQLVEIFIEFLDKNVHCIDFFSECKYPNSIHLFLAQMIRRGHFVITTNFDSLIEYSLIESGIPKDKILPVITKNEFLRWTNPYEIFDGGKFSVYKIHGSPIDIIKNTSKEELRDSLIVTIRSFVKNKKGLNIFELEPYKQEAVENLLKNRTLVVMGYSGSDDFDIIPTLESVKGIDEIIWIDHDNTQDLKIWELEEFDGEDIDKTLFRFKKGNRDIKIFKVKGITENLISQETKMINLSERFELKPIHWLSSKLITPPKIAKLQMCYLILIKFSLLTKALACVNKILGIANNILDSYWQSVGYSNKGNILMIQGNLDGALECFDKAYEIIKMNPPLSKHLGMILFNKGKVLLRRGQLKKAKKIYEEALELAKAMNNEVMEANISIGLGTISRTLGNNDISEQYFQTTLSLFEKNNDVIGKSVVLLHLALNYRLKGHYEQEKKHIEFAILVSEKLNSRYYLSACYTELAHHYSNFNDLENALHYYKKALNLAIDMENRNRQADILRSIGNLFSQKGRLSEALEKYEESYQINTEIGSKQGESVNLEDMGYVFERNGDISTAIKYYRKALEINQEIGNYGKILNNYNSLGLAYHKMKKIDEALENYRICEEMMKNVDDPLVLCNFYLKFSSILIELSKNDEASKYLTLAKELCDKFPNKLNLMHLNANLGKLREKKGDYKKSIFYYKKALKIAGENDFKRDEARYLNKLGLLYKKLGNFDKALDNYEKALSITKILNDHYGEANILFNIGSICNKKSDFNKALKKFLDAKHLIDEHKINDIELKNKINKAIEEARKNINWKKA